MAKPEGLRGEWREGESLARYTSWGVGGVAERWFRPADVADLQLFFRQTPVTEPLFWLGLGSNLLVRDGGIRGTVIATHALKGLALRAEGRVWAEAGVTCARLARFCADASLGAAAFFAGIPGSVGGALAMNAGCYGRATWDALQTVTSINRQGVLQTYTQTDFQTGYRQVVPPVPELGFIAACWQFPPADATAERVQIRTLLQQREASQPLNQRSCGSVFRNPGAGLYAGQLIEASGLKGYRVGAAQVSEKHANFIVNLGTARAADIETLIQHVQQVVAQRQGVHLLPEVRVTGEMA